MNLKNTNKKVLNGYIKDFFFFLSYGKTIHEKIDSAFVFRKQTILRHQISMHICIFLDFSQSQHCLIKHVLILLVLSPARNWLPSIASFLSCDSHTPQIRPGRLMTASQLLLVQTIQASEREQPVAATQNSASVRISGTLLDVAKGKILTPLSWLDRQNVTHHSKLGCHETVFPCIVRLASPSI